MGAEQRDLTGDVITAIDNAQEMIAAGEGSEEGNSAKQIEQARRIQALTYRLAGYSLEQIASQMGTTPNNITRWLDDVLEKTASRNADRMRELENLRMDRLQAAYWTKALEGDEKSANMIMKISQHRSRINGLYAPTKIEMAVGIKQEMEIALRDFESVMGQAMQELTVLQEENENEEIAEEVIEDEEELQDGTQPRYGAPSAVPVWALDDDEEQP